MNRSLWRAAGAPPHTLRGFWRPNASVKQFLAFSGGHARQPGAGSGAGCQSHLLTAGGPSRHCWVGRGNHTGRASAFLSPSAETSLLLHSCEHQLLQIPYHFPAPHNPVHHSWLPTASQSPRTSGHLSLWHHATSTVPHVWPPAQAASCGSAKWTTHSTRPGGAWPLLMPLGVRWDPLPLLACPPAWMVVSTVHKVI